MMTLEQYFQAKPHTQQHTYNALDLLERRNALRAEWMEAMGKECPVCPNTGTEISGSKGGTGDGGFRLETATTGKTLSSHKEAAGVDDYDPRDEFDDWLDRFERGDGQNTKLAEHNLYREHPNYTRGWVHLSTRKPPSGRRTFVP